MVGIIRLTNPAMKDLMKYVMISTLISFMMMNTVAMTTNNRVLLSGVLVASALAASHGDYIFSPLELATLTTVVLVLNFPRKVSESSESCTAPGYTADPVLGCYRLYTEPKTNTDARQQCANDGGRLLLMNSEAEYERVKSFVEQNSFIGMWIQGSRSSVSSPWLTDNGDPLPYLGPTYTEISSPTALAFVMNAIGATGGVEGTRNVPFICEI
ncbi:hemolymph lipopolysaccharide-binding protein-like isoform X2 [Crassostrea angulata]|uniref:hemolymph lipopolysaccharide-binding protein-like isoform X2 n=2 Tax=Magallana angulata TaxID=2784310 RepID=UPI0022B12698|nr:hemolymph lipopolysaccharide-binding protein-like isoform X2 [Crassostrea angulata]